jgi:putative sigma-54 modulation protein
LNIEVIGRHLEVTASMREYAEGKAGKLERLFERLGSIRVTLGSEGQEMTAEIQVRAPKGIQIVGEARGETIYAAVDLAIDKVERQVTKLKEKLSGHRPRRSQS